MLILCLFLSTLNGTILSIYSRGAESIIDQANALRLNTIILCVLTLLTSRFTGERIRLGALKRKLLIQLGLQVV